MNCKSNINIKYHAAAFLLYTIFWIWSSSHIGLTKTHDVLGALLGTAGQYTYYIIITTIILFGALIIADSNMSLKNINLMLRKGRNYSFIFNLKCCAENLAIYVSIYIGIPIMYYCITDFAEFISDYKFLPIMLLFALGLYEIYFIYILLYFYICSFVRQKYIAITSVVAISFLIVFLQRQSPLYEILYGALNIIEILSGNNINILRWFIFRAMDLCILLTLFTIVKDRYNRKDIL